MNRPAVKLINLITISRMVVVIPVFTGISDFALLVIATWAAASDFLDGYLARRYNLTTKLGGILDQIADKVFHLIILSYLAYSSLIDATFVLLFFIREITIVVLRYLKLVSKDSNYSGKVKSALVYTFIILVVSGKLFPTVKATLPILAFEIIILSVAYVSLVLPLIKGKKMLNK